MNYLVGQDHWKQNPRFPEYQTHQVNSCNSYQDKSYSKGGIPIKELREISMLE